MTTKSLKRPANRDKEDESSLSKTKKKVSVVKEPVVEESVLSSDYSESEADTENDVQDDENTNSNDDSSSNVKGNKKSKIESRQEAKKVKLERQSHRPHNDLVQNAKKLWEKVRRRDLSAADRARPLRELFALLDGKFNEIIMKHDASRMVQTCVKYGNSEQRLQIANELVGSYVEMSKSRYGKHIVKRLLQYCPSVRKTIVAEFRGHVGKLIRHADASAVLEEIYGEYANGKEKSALLMEFYGPEFVLFSNEKLNANISNNPGINGNNSSLSEILESKAPEGKAKILKYLREAIDGLINKGSLQHTLIHRLMLEYVLNEGDASKIQDFISTVEDKLVEILHTFEGSRVVSRCLALATAKQRKSIIKSFKPFIEKIAREEYGHQVLLVAFAVVDDTVLMRSVIIAEIIKKLPELLADKHSSRLVLYLLATQSDSVSSVLNSQSAQQIKESISVATLAGTSKKDPALRSKELVADFVEPLGDLVLSVGELEEKGDFCFSTMLADSSKHALLLECALLLPTVGEKFINEAAGDLGLYEDFSFRALMKKWTRKCSAEQAEKWLTSVAPVMNNLICSEAAYILMALFAAKPELKSMLPERDAECRNEHAMALYEKINN